MNFVTRPNYIKQAIALIVASLVIGVMKIILDYEFLGSLGSIRFVSMTMAITVAIIGFLTYKIWHGRNWARIIFVVLFLIGVYPALQVVPAEAERSIFVAIFSILQALAQLSVIVLLYLPDSRKWFAEVKVVKNA